MTEKGGRKAHGREYMCACSWLALLYSRDEHNMVKYLYSNIKKATWEHGCHSLRPYKSTVDRACVVFQLPWRPEAQSTVLETDGNISLEFSGVNRDRAGRVEGWTNRLWRRLSIYCSPLYFHSNHTHITWAETKDKGLADKYLPGECIKECIHELKFLASAADF